MPQFSISHRNNALAFSITDLEILNLSSADNIKSLEIKDLLGRVIYFDSKINSTNTTVSTSSFSNNIYTVSCLINDKLIVKKIVISH